MKIFIDSAKLDEIEEAYYWGVPDGVTTNPSLIKKAMEDLKKKGKKITMKSYINKILRTAKGTPVSLEVTGYIYKDMVRQGKKLYKIFNPVADNVCIKIPVNPSFEGDTGRNMEGIKAVRDLARAGIPVNCTLIFTPEQALMAAKAGAKMVSPFAGRVDDHIRNQSKISFDKHDYFPAQGMEKRRKTLMDEGIVSGIDLIKKTVEIFRKHEIKAEVLAASVRNKRQAREAALAGADIATLPLKVIREMLIHYKSQEGMKKFTEAAVREYKDITR